MIFVLSTGVERIGSGPLTKYAFVSQNRVWLYGGGGVGNPFQHSLMHAHIHSKPYGPWPLIWHPGRRRGGPSYPPTWHNYGLFIGPPWCLGPWGGGLNLPFWPFSPYTTHIKMKCRVGTLCLCSHYLPYISSKDEKGIVQCYISSRTTTLRKSFNVHCSRPKSSIPPMLHQLSLVYLEYSMSKQICRITKIYCHWYWWSNNAIWDRCRTVML